MARLRSLIPLGELQQIRSRSAAVFRCSSWPSARVMEEPRPSWPRPDWSGHPSLELVSSGYQPGPSPSAYHYAVSRLSSLPEVNVWALQGNFHHLPPCRAT